MGIRIGISLVIIAITILIHALGSFFLIRYQIRHIKQSIHHWKLGHVLRVLVSSAISLILLHCIEIMIWAVFYLVLPGIQEIKTFEEATYFSFVTYTTLGYGDITLGPAWRIISGLEAINGIILIGWTTAMFYSIVQSITQKYRADKSGIKKDDR